ncbi:hypothetical protein DW804_14425 [Bacteroides stercoris]|nr:hypothetical protein DW804_14425 [Bacteroides stercoris]
MLNYKRFTFNYRHSVFYCISKYYLCGPSYLGLYCKILRNSCGGDFRSVGPCFNHYYGRLSEAVR